MQRYAGSCAEYTGMTASLPLCVGLCTSCSLPSKCCSLPSHELMAKPLNALQVGTGSGQGGAVSTTKGGAKQGTQVELRQCSRLWTISMQCHHSSACPGWVKGMGQLKAYSQ